MEIPIYWKCVEKGVKCFLCFEENVIFVGV